MNFSEPNELQNIAHPWSPSTPWPNGVTESLPTRVLGALALAGEVCPSKLRNGQSSLSLSLCVQKRASARRFKRRNTNTQLGHQQVWRFWQENLR